MGADALEMDLHDALIDAEVLLSDSRNRVLIGEVSIRGTSIACSSPWFRLDLVPQLTSVLRDCSLIESTEYRSIFPGVVLYDTISQMSRLLRRRLLNSYPPWTLDSTILDGLSPALYDLRVSLNSQVGVYIPDDRPTFDYPAPGLAFLSSDAFNAQNIVTRGMVPPLPEVESLFDRLPDVIFYEGILNRIPRLARLQMRTWGTYFRRRISFIMGPRWELLPNLCTIFFYIGVPYEQDFNTLLPPSKLFCVKSSLGDYNLSRRTLLDFQTGNPVSLPAGVTVDYLLDQQYEVEHVGCSLFYTMGNNIYPVLQLHNNSKQFILEVRGSLYFYDSSRDHWRLLDTALNIDERVRDIYTPSRFSYDHGIGEATRVRRLFNASVAYPSVIGFGHFVYAISWSGSIVAIDIGRHATHFVVRNLVLPEDPAFDTIERRGAAVFSFVADRERLFLLRIGSQRYLTVYRIQGLLVQKTYHIDESCFVISRYGSFCFRTSLFRFPSASNTVLVLADDHAVNVCDQYVVLPYLPILAPAPIQDEDGGVVVAGYTYPRGIRSLLGHEIFAAFHI